MAVTLDALTGAGAPTGGLSTISWSHTTASGVTLLIATIGWNDGARTVTAATHGGVAMTNLGAWTSGSAGTDRRVEVWYRVNPPAGSATVSFTVSGTVALLSGESVTLFGTTTSSIFGAVSSDSDTAAGSTQPSTLTVSSAAGRMVVTALAARGTTAPTAPGSATNSRVDTGVGSPNSYTGLALIPGAASVSAAWAMPGGDNSHAEMMVSIDAAAATALNRLRIGDSLVNAIRVGDSAVSRVYAGDTQIWP